ncbi:YiaA/YiaB family inner membrane protein [Parachitinimonas caeni]|uniref:YiaA/YiaB family inner membrane protein n=1 Tax=Parachitinimonas caeni TaxID=3031301 RepID=A0ABT7DXW6_9NEIS|nr:YiaA/YiaB family inner membrane protein [Parachitinimonas caeni]MDK2124907.1 YiaA/YiaB family inner membrane protein [Parachitinimonas caeni]
MAKQYLIRRDTKGWIVQVWASFALSVGACGMGVWNLPHETLDRAFLALGYFFCLFSAFSVAKLIRDNRDERVDTGAWMVTVWVGFAVAVGLTGWGLYRMTIPEGQRAYMIVSWLFLMSSVFTLAKTVRDKQDADMLEHAAAVEPQTIAQTLPRGERIPSPRVPESQRVPE